MFTVYILYSKKFNKLYIGFSSNMLGRMKSHNELGTKGYTVKYRPWVIVFTEVFNEKSSAMKREKQLKSAKGREFCWKRVQEYLQD